MEPWSAVAQPEAGGMHTAAGSGASSSAFFGAIGEEDGGGVATALLLPHTGKMPFVASLLALGGAVDAVVRVVSVVNA